MVKDIIPNEIFRSNTHHLTLGFLEASGTINAAPNQPADKSTNKSEAVVSKRGSTCSTISKISDSKLFVNQTDVSAGREEGFQVRIYPPSGRLKTK